MGLSIILTAEESIALQSFRGTGQYVGKDARLKDRLRKSKTALDVLLALRRKALLEHFIADRWYLTEAGRDVVAGRIAVEAK